MKHKDKEIIRKKKGLKKDERKKINRKKDEKTLKPFNFKSYLPTYLHTFPQIINANHHQS